MNPLPVIPVRYLRLWQEVTEPENALDVLRRAGDDRRRAEDHAPVRFARAPGESNTRAARRLMDIWQTGAAVE